MKALQVQVEQHDAGVVVFELAGSLDADGVMALTQACEKHVDEATTKLVIHMAEVSFISSSGIGMLIMISEDVSLQGGQVILAELSPEVETVFEILDLEDAVRIAPTIDAAIRKLRAA